MEDGEEDLLINIDGDLRYLLLTIIRSIAEAAYKDFPQGDACDTIVVRATAVVVVVIHVLVWPVTDCQCSLSFFLL